jgi:hypothetical protein
MRATEEQRPGKPGPKPRPFWSMVEKGDGCWEWKGNRFPNGYGCVSINRVNTGAHRRAYELTYGLIPAGMVGRHDCDNKPCVRPDHLRLGTSADNARDAVERGLSLKGERSPNAKLTTAAVLDIRSRYAAGGITQAALAAEYGVVEGAIWNVLHGRSWVEVA